GMIEFVPAFTTVGLYYDPQRTSEAALTSHISNLVATTDATIDPQPRVVEIPVCYGGEFGSDLEFVAKHAKLTPQEVIEIHAAADYLVHMIGFAPGFPYLGGMSSKIAAPRGSSSAARRWLCFGRSKTRRRFSRRVTLFASAPLRRNNSANSRSHPYEYPR